MATRIPEAIVEEVSRRTDIVDVISAYVELKMKGDRWWGLCPFHSEKTPSFTVNRESGFFYCFGCEKSGTAYQFLMETESLSFPDAVRRLADKAGIDIPDSNSTQNLHQNEDRKALVGLYSRVSRTFQWLLENKPKAAHARNYLEKRGIKKNTYTAYNLGWTPDEGNWLYQFLLGKNYSKKFLAESGLFSRKTPEWAFFVDRLMFPIMPSLDRVNAYSGRDLTQKGPKYKNSPETHLYKKSRELYGLAQAKPSIRTKKRAYLCEGNLDVLACSQAGIMEVVAPLGTAFTEEQAQMLKRSTDTLIMAFDGDEAGRKATLRAAITAEKMGFNVQSVVFPPGTDPAEILETQGEKALKKILLAPMNIFDFLLNLLVGAESAHTGDAQEEVIRELTPYLNAVKSEVRCEAYLKQLAESMNAHPMTVFREYKSQNGMQRRISVKTRSTDVDSAVVQFLGDDLYLMTAVAVRSEYFSILKEELAPEMLRDGRALAVYRIMDELSINGSVPRTDVIVSHLNDDPHLRDLIIKRASTGLFDEKAENTIRNKIKRIKERALAEESNKLETFLLNDTSDPEQTKARMRLKQKIDREIMMIRQGTDGGN